MIPCARFDDHSIGAERAFALRGLQDTIIARRLDEVRPAFERVEQATREGMWAGGYLSYEAAPAFDPALAVRLAEPDDPFRHLPLLWFGLFDRREDHDPFGTRLTHPAPYSVSAWTPSIERTEYLAAVRRIRRLIGEGETYQANFTFRLRAAFSGDPYELYRDLVLAQRGGYAAYFDVGRYRVISASPELFFEIDGDQIRTRPMKGTIRRGRWPDEDIELATRLEGSEKDRAENLMIVDLIRNDLGRVGRPGSVVANELLSLERYETVWQLTSQIGATIDPEVSSWDVLAALFPSGSVTGAPKVRTMEIIAELEDSPRGVYCGALGVLAPAGAGAPRALFSVGIRTVVIDIEEGLAEYGVGGGITWDSTPEVEYEEARTKAALLVERRPEFDLFETMRWDELSGFSFLEEHLDRIEASAGYFGFACDRSALRTAVAAAVADQSGSRRVKLILHRDGAIDVEIDSEPLEPIADGPDSDRPSIRVALDEEPVSSQNVFLFHKTTRRRLYEQRAWRHPDVQEVLLCNERGEVTEATNANVAVKFAGQWWTPRLDSGCLPGVFRRVLLEKGTLRERVIAVHELASAEGLAVINSVRGWRRAELVADET